MTHPGDAPFRLDPKLASDTILLGDFDLCRLLLMDDARFPWLVLVPRVPDRMELDDLDAPDSARLLEEIRRAMQALRKVAGCAKLNVAAIGNLVRQLHVHVVARNSGDAAWPGPVWGHGRALPYAPEARDRLVRALQRETTLRVDEAAPAAR